MKKKRIKKRIIKKKEMKTILRTIARFEDASSFSEILRRKLSETDRDCTKYTFLVVPKFPFTS